MIGEFPIALTTFGILFAAAVALVVICFLMPVTVMRIYLAYKKMKRDKQ